MFVCTLSDLDYIYNMSYILQVIFDGSIFSHCSVGSVGSIGSVGSFGSVTVEFEIHPLQMRHISAF